MKIRDLKERVDQFLAASQLTPAEKLGLEAYAAVQAHLRSEGAAPNNKQLQKFRRGLIMDQLSPVDPADLETIQALEDGLTIDDLEAEKDLFRNIALRQARWVAAALQPLAPTGEKDAVHEAIRVSIDQFMAESGFEPDIIKGLEAIAALKASVYCDGEPTFGGLQDNRASEIRDFFQQLSRADQPWIEQEKQRMLDQAKWVAFALKSAGHLTQTHLSNSSNAAADC